MSHDVEDQTIDSSTKVQRSGLSHCRFDLHPKSDWTTFCPNFNRKPRKLLAPLSGERFKRRSEDCCKRDTLTSRYCPVCSTDTRSTIDGISLHINVSIEKMIHNSP
jgi:hypothetical protein